MIELQRALSSEAVSLSELACRTFTETFETYNTPKDLSEFLTTSFSAEQLARELASPYHEVYVARADGKPIGYLQLNFNTTEKGLEGLPLVEIGRLYVDQKFIGQNVGKLLMDTAITIARNRRAAYVWLGVWEQNYRAIAFYTQWGFEIFGSHIFQLGSDAQIDMLMKKHLRSNT